MITDPHLAPTDRFGSGSTDPEPARTLRLRRSDAFPLSVWERNNYGIVETSKLKEKAEELVGHSLEGTSSRDLVAIVRAQGIELLDFPTAIRELQHLVTQFESRLPELCKEITFDSFLVILEEYEEIFKRVDLLENAAELYLDENLKNDDALSTDEEVKAVIVDASARTKFLNVGCKVLTLIQKY